MYERHDYDERAAGCAPQAQPLPPAFDDLLDRLAQAAEERRALRQAKGAAD